MQARKDLIEKQKKTVFAKDIVAKNPLFTLKQIQQFWKLFNLYADSFRKADVADMLTTAQTLGFKQKYRIVYDAFVLLAEQLDGESVHFQQFITGLTQKLGLNTNQDGRRKMFELVDLQGKEKLTYSDLKRISHDLDLDFDENQLTEIIHNLAGPKERNEVTYQQFENYIAKKIQQAETRKQKIHH